MNVSGIALAQWHSLCALVSGTALAAGSSRSSFTGKLDYDDHETRKCGDKVSAIGR
jgi:hypothetical protein